MGGGRGVHRGWWVPWTALTVDSLQTVRDTVVAFSGVSQEGAGHRGQ